MARDYRDQYPDANLDVCQENVDDFWKFIAERHAIWERRARGEDRPWTDNPILATTHYTNVYRELDRGTLWFQARVAAQMNGPDKRINLLRAAVTYRQIGRPETFEFCTLGPVHCLLDPERLADVLTELKAEGQPRSTNAYVCCRGDDAAIDTARWLANGGAEAILARIDKWRSAEMNWNTLKCIPGIGGFLAYEVLTDLLQCKILYDGDGNILNEDDWANVGPGSTEGLRLLYPSSPKSMGLYKMEGLRDLARHYLRKLGLKLTPPPGTIAYQLDRGPLTLRGVEHCLCEYSKYWLQKRGLGKSRREHVCDGHGGLTEKHLRRCVDPVSYPAV